MRRIAFDSRDFGPVLEHNIIATVVPVLILWGDRRPHEEVSEDEKNQFNSEQGLTFSEQLYRVPHKGGPRAVRRENTHCPWFGVQEVDKSSKTTPYPTKIRLL